MAHLTWPAPLFFLTACDFLTCKFASGFLTFNRRSSWSQSWIDQPGRPAVWLLCLIWIGSGGGERLKERIVACTVTCVCPHKPAGSHGGSEGACDGWMDGGWRRSPWITDKRPSRHARTRPQCPVHGHSARTVARAGAAVRRPEQRPDDDMIWCLIVVSRFSCEFVAGYINREWWNNQIYSFFFHFFFVFVFRVAAWTVTGGHVLQLQVAAHVPRKQYYSRLVAPAVQCSALVARKNGTAAVCLMRRGERCWWRWSATYGDGGRRSRGRVKRLAWTVFAFNFSDWHLRLLHRPGAHLPPPPPPDISLPALPTCIVHGTPSAP